MTIRNPAVAGTLYEADTQRLLVQMETWLVSAPVKTSLGTPKVLIAPHSGFHFSGEAAARAYQTLNAVYDRIRRVILLGPSHRTPVDTIVLPEDDAFATPLGIIPLDKTAMEWLANQPGVERDNNLHRPEHSLEMQLPFLQAALEDFFLVPMIVGQIGPERLASLLDELWLGDESLIIVSSGLSRKLPLAQAREQDRRTAQRILEGEPVLTYPEACGYSALNGVLSWAKRHQLTGRELCLTTSADQGGNADSVRGFGSFVLS